MDNEATITINGVLATSAMSMALRVAIESFGASLETEGLGDDEHGRTMCALYLERIKEIQQLLYAPDRADLKAAESVKAPSGYVLVPVEPTEQMISAGEEASEGSHDDAYDDDGTSRPAWENSFVARACYKAMLAAAPTKETDR